MNFLIDVHLPISLSKYLDKQPGCKSIHVNQILQKWHTTDTAISMYADENDLVVVTKDSDFISSHLVKKTPKKLIRVVLGNISNNELVTLFERYFLSIASLSDKNEFYVELSKEQVTVID